jgi:hypothetical protein
LRLGLVEEGGSRFYCAPQYCPVALPCRSCQRPPDAGSGAETKNDKRIEPHLMQALC